MTTSAGVLDYRLIVTFFMVDYSLRFSIVYEFQIRYFKKI